MHLQGGVRSEAPEGAHGSGEAAAFYRYRDSSGRVVIVDSLSRVPSSQRAAAETVVLAPVGESSAASTARELARDLHMPSFIAGVGLALLLGLVLVLVGRKLGRFFQAALVIGAVGLGVVAYFGWLRRTTGQSGDLLASPSTLIEDARGAVRKMNERTEQQQRTLKELEHVE